MSPRTLRICGLAVAGGVLLGCALLSVSLGARAVPAATVWDALWHFDGSYEHHVIVDLRLPRALFGVFVGAALGVAGALMQGLTRNPLAEPGILGVNSGAAAAVVLAVYVFGWTRVDQYLWMAFAGAGAAAVAVYFLGTRGRSGATPVRLALAGTAIAAVLQGAVYGVTVLDEFVFDQIRFWQVGSLAGRDLEILIQVAPFLLAGLIIALALAPALNAVALGEDMATALGAKLNRTKILAAASVVLLCGAAVAAAGPIWFVGLVVPHIARSLVGPDQRWLLPYSAVLAAILLTAADTLGRFVLPGGELEVGIITALVGAPVFIALVRRKRMAKL